MATAPEIEALEAEETEEEKTMDELKSALEASRTGDRANEPEVDGAGKETSTEVVEGEPGEDTDKEVTEGIEEVPEKDEVKEPAPDDSRENRELRQILREQKRELALMKAKLARMEKGVADIQDEDDKAAVELSKIEALETQIAAIGQQKGPIFDTLIEAMEANPKYEDIREVCSREHFDDIFEELARVISQKEGRDPTEVALEIEAEVWLMGNPYKFMYGIIKDNHPRYASTNKEKEVATPDKVKEPEKKPVKEPPKAPTSIASVGGSDADSKSGWTAKRIDELPEQELSKVPEEVYQKYLRGELD